MNQSQKDRIKELRLDGLGYVKIAQILDLSENTVKSYCKRNNIGCTAAVKKTGGNCCRNCGKELVQIPKRKTRKFCSDNCRTAWWNSHTDRVNKKAVYSYKCPNCGREFTAYGNSKRKYCCHSCYISFRFKGGGADVKQRAV